MINYEHKATKITALTGQNKHTISCV